MSKNVRSLWSTSASKKTKREHANIFRSAVFKKKKNKQSVKFNIYAWSKQGKQKGPKKTFIQKTNIAFFSQNTNFSIKHPSKVTSRFVDTCGPPKT